ncbi:MULTISPECIES: class I SAM-dependent methyltransferase [unclassified Helicobacter]|uniref:class I SAM-dependent methyltransferase n=1 Tax=unclassified Helicobacter TaxID=2593540 RepID=UPI000CF0998E|nr:MULTISPECIES: methyltransferase domain-containing protein [unclassified Helicobacter]
MNYFQARNISQDFYKYYTLPFSLESIIKKLPHHSRILDFGCGYGQNLLAIQKLLDSNGGGIIQGIDIDPQAVDFCNKNNLEVSLVDNIFDYQPHYKFDLIILMHVLEHFPKEKIIPLLKHFKDHFLTQSGKIFISVPNAQSNTGCYWAYEDFTHQTLFTAGSLIYVLKMSHFQTIQIIDKDCTEGLNLFKKIIRKAFLALYRLHIKFWNCITGSSFHSPSPEVYSYEIKVLASV